MASNLSGMRGLGRGLLEVLRRRQPRSDARATPFSLAYVVPVGEAVHNEMRRLQLQMLREYGPNPGMEVSPHITLKQGFGARTLEPFEAYLDRLAAEVEPFEITVKDYGFFDEGIVFLDVVRTQRLDALRRRVVRDLSTEFGVRPNDLEGDRYHYHATLHQGLPRASLERARQVLRGVRLEFRFTCDTLALLCNTGAGWMTYQRRSLAGPRPSRSRP